MSRMGRAVILLARIACARRYDARDMKGDCPCVRAW
jgi:hypothetical protein